jgi:hypothetical protein
MDKKIYWQALALLLLFCFFALELQAFACATCGCSEVCPIAMMETNNTTGKTGSLLSDSIWGNLILKMAYQRDEKLQKLSKNLNGANAATTYAIAGVAGGTMAQNVVSMCALNPPVGIEDSYVPGSIGLGLDGATNIAFGARMLLNYRARKKIQARKLVIREQVEAILHHLEYSQTNCPQSQKELAQIIGERAARDCIQLWQSSHVTAALLPNESFNAPTGEPIQSPAAQP